MNTLQIVFTVLSSIAGLFLLVYAFRTKKPLRTIFTSAFLGVVSLFVISMTGPMTGISVAMNVYTLSTSAILGIPGVIVLVLTKSIWGV
ncbi:MAG: hypothetical protein BGN88_04355 [Clostridiales bacterium 43-6]|nr:MAG: hypothetical protein BGN88_04355 [Clostridiales bacterium 43-6]